MSLPLEEVEKNKQKQLTENSKQKEENPSNTSLEPGMLSFTQALSKYSWENKILPRAMKIKNV